MVLLTNIYLPMSFKDSSMGFSKATEGEHSMASSQEHNYFASSCTTEERISTRFPMEFLTPKWL